MRTPRRRALRKRGRRADAPYQGASAALSVATLAFARALGRHEQACRHTARTCESLRVELLHPSIRMPKLALIAKLSVWKDFSVL